ncbi:MAG: ATP-binding protein [Verrucomicrobiota bacterium]
MTEYAITSAGNGIYPDPSDWQLLGSSDGKSWVRLDRQTNQTFTARLERLAFKISNRIAYQFYRLEVDDTSTVQLGELELIGPAIGVAGENELYSKITSSGTAPFAGSSDNAFDGDPSTPWIDYSNGGTSNWLQCEYTARSEIVVTNVDQFVLLARHNAARNPLLDRAPQIRSDLTTRATRPTRPLKGYALTSANDFPSRDPRDWRLLGSNNGGDTWDTLDERRGETFDRRFERRVFGLTNQTTYATYRLQIDSIRTPASPTNYTPGYCVQLAEVEPIYSEKESDTRFSLAISAQGDNPPNESAEMAFDGHPETKWLDFFQAQANMSGWIQWQYLPYEGVPVFNLGPLLTARPRPPQPMIAQLDGVVAAWDPGSNAVGLLDESGFQMFKLGSVVGELHPGNRIRLSGELQLAGEVPTLLNPKITSVGTLPVFAEIYPGQFLSADRHFLIGTVEGRVIGVSDDPLHAEIRMESDNGAGNLLVRLFNPKHAPLPFFTNCRLRVHGVVEAVLDENGQRVAGVIWVASPDDVALARPTDKEWSQWPEFPLHELLGKNSPVAPGTPVRVGGVIGVPSAGKGLVVSEGTNHLTAVSEQTLSFPLGTPVEVVGFFNKAGPNSTLDSAQFRVASIIQPGTLPKQNRVIDQAHPVTGIREILDLAKSLPATNFPVRIRGVITYIDLGLDAFYIQNGADAVLCGGQFFSGLAPTLRQEGMYIECEGTADTTYPVNVNSGGPVTVLGKGQWPDPRRASWNDLMSGDYDNQWVEVEGVVSVVEKQRLALVVTGGQLVVWVNEMDKNCRDRLLGSLVRVHGVCAPLLNSRGQRLGQRLLVPSADHLEMVKAAPENPFDLRSVPISRITQHSDSFIHLVKTTGVVTYKDPQLLFIQDAGDGLRVETRDLVDVEPGDQVEVVGLPAPDGFSPKLVQALVRKEGRSPLPAASPIDLLDTDVDGEGGSEDATRGLVDGTLLGRSFNESLEVLELRLDQSKKTFFAYLPFETDTNKPVPIGSRLRLEGVFKAKMNTAADYGQTITSFEMYLNSPANITVLDWPSWWTTEHTLWLLGGLGLLLVMILSWVGSLRNQVRQRTRELSAEINEHKSTESKLEAEIVERKRMEVEVAKTHKELLFTSHQAGMAEVATSVLHNVGNALNSVNISVSLVYDKLRKSRTVNISRVADLMREHAADLGDFLTHHPKGQQLPMYLSQLAGHLADEQTFLLTEIDSLKNNVEHIKVIVAMQQSYGKVSGVTETVKLTDLVEDALRINAGAQERHDVQTLREYDPHVPEITVEKHKVLQILVNVVRNAKHACDESGHEDKRMTVRVSNGDDRVRITVMDNGVGIPAENLTKIFSYGFTTRKGGHGFGLHSGALAAIELGGSLKAQSEGLGKGATFILELPCQPHGGVWTGSARPNSVPNENFKEAEKETRL